MRYTLDRIDIALLASGILALIVFVLRTLQRAS